MGPAAGMYIQLSIMVFRQLVLSLMVFMTILFAFSFSFHLSLRRHHVYDNALTSFLKTITMMVGEFNFDYDFTFESVRGVGGSNGVVQALLMLFILMVTITIANLIIAIVIENISKMFDQAEAHQLSKTVEQITTVDNVKHTLFKCCPFLRRIFAKTAEGLAASGLSSVESWFRSGTELFHQVYTYHEVYRKEMEPTDFLLPTRIVQRALAQTHKQTGLRSTASRNLGSRPDYTSGWRLEVEVATARGLLED